MGASVAAAQSAASIFQWQGGSGSWALGSSWTVSGVESFTPPNEEAVVWIDSQEDIVLEIPFEVSIRSLVITGSGSVSFRASKAATIQISQQLTIISEKVEWQNVFPELANSKQFPPFYAAGAAQKGQIKAILGQSKGGNAVAKSAGPCPFFALTPNPTGPTCNDFNNGIASVLPPTGGVGPYTFQWVGGPSTRQWLNVGAGTYTIIVIDLGQGGLPCNTNVFVNEPGPLTVFSITSSPPLCADVCNGTASPIVIGGNGLYTYLWSSGETTQAASALCVDYSLQVTDQAGCQLDSNFVFTNAPDTIQFNAAITNILCFAGNDAAIDLTISGGVGGFSFAWTGPLGFTASTEDISALTPGTYTIQVTDANNCIADTNYTITENPQLAVVPTVVSNPCFGDAAGSISLVIADGLPPYTTDWSGPNGFTSASANIANLFSGDYDLVLTDAAGCVLLVSYAISEPDEIIPTLTKIDLSCFGGTQGSANASATGGSPGYTFSWSGPNGFSNSGGSLSSLAVGTYIVSITDASNCTVTDSIEILEPEELVVDFSISPITCNNGNNGAIDASVLGGSVPYNFAWTGPNGFTSNLEDIDNLGVGTYFLNITDANGCMLSAQASLGNPVAYNISASLTPVFCAGDADGAINLTVMGGLSPYNFDWSGPNGFASSVEDITSLDVGDYTVIITDQLGCIETATYAIAEPLLISVSFSSSAPGCFGSSDGSIDVVVSGGTPNYTLSWAGPNGFTSTIASLSGLQAGLYNLTVTDQNSCVLISNFDLTQPNEILVDAVLIIPSCVNGNDGEVAVTFVGGQAPYSVLWSGPNGFSSTSTDISGLAAGTYSLSATDFTNCPLDTTFVLIAPSGLVVNALVNDAVCTSDSNGSITIDISGGTSPYQISWVGPNGFISDQALIGLLQVGNYELTVIDDQGCSFTGIYAIDGVFDLMAQATISNVSCSDFTTGAISVIMSGGLAPYDLFWTGPNGFSATAASIAGLGAGTYSLLAIDLNGCELNADYEIIEPLPISLDVTNTPVTCNGIDDGNLGVMASGGTPNYFFSWTGPNGFSSASANISNLQGGDYVLLVTDQNGCTADSTVAVGIPDVLVIDFLIQIPSCVLDDGSIQATVSGGVVAVDYTYTWTDALGATLGTSATLSNLGLGSYTLIVSDDNGCSIEETILLEQNSFLVQAEISDVSCDNNMDGNISLTITGGEQPFGFDWSGPNGFSSNQQNISNLNQGNYTLTVTDNAGCTENYTYDIGIQPPIVFNPIVLGESCGSAADGTITLQPAGGAPGYNVVWTGPSGYSGSGLSNTGLSPGQYFVSITDTQGCSNDTIIIIQKAPEYVVSFVTSGETCAEQPTGIIETQINITTGNPQPFSFAWTGPNGFAASSAIINNLPAGLYSLMLSDAFGCAQNFDVTILQSDSIAIAIAVQQSNCLQTDGALTASVTGGSGGFSFQWTDQNNVAVGNTAAIGNIGAGIYTISVTDANGCNLVQPVVLSDSQEDLVVSSIEPLCANSSDGSISTEIVNGTPPFVFQWFNQGVVISNAQNLINVPTGTYSIIVTDSNGCIYGTTLVLGAPDALVTDFTVDLVSCTANDGAISVLISGGTDPYGINWAGPGGFTSNAPEIEDLAVGTYVFTILDLAGCVLTDSLELTNTPDIETTAAIANLNCAGDQNGAIVLVTSGGTAPYTFDWNGPNGFTSNLASIDNLLAGIYEVTIQDSRNCTSIFIFEVLSPDSIEVTFQTVQPECGLANGSITAQILGGTADLGYFISWTDLGGNSFGGNALIENLLPGIYTILIIDNNGCSIQEAVSLSNPGAAIAADFLTESCAGFVDGFIDLTILGVAQPFTISWSGPSGFSSNTEDISGLLPGEYTYQIIGADNCEYFGSYLLQTITPITINTQVEASCFGQNSGSIDAAILGGVAPYDHNWTGPNGFQSQNLVLTNLAPGEYTLVVVDANGCQFSEIVSLGENPEIVANISSIDLNCFGTDNGQLSIVTSGGTAPLAVQWVGPGGFQSAEEVLENLPSGTYSYTVSDFAGCSIAGVIALTQPDSLGVSIDRVSPGCSDPVSLGSINAVAFGGISPYSISWTGPSGFSSVEANIIDLQAGVYTYTLVDSNLCTVIDSVELFDATPIIVEAVLQNPTCADSTDARISLVLSGGTTPFNIAWNGPGNFTSDLITIEQLIPGEYQLTVTDAFGCSRDSIFTIAAPSFIGITLSEQLNATCNTSSDGALAIAVTGGTPGYTLAWSGPNGFVSDQPALSELTIGTYTVEVTDSNGCSTSIVAQVDFDLEISVDAGEDLTFCPSDLPMWINGSGTNVDAYVWLTADGGILADSSSVLFSGSSGDEILILEGINGVCIARDTVLVNVLPEPDVDAGPDQEVFLEQLFTLGGSPTSNSGVTYNWSPTASGSFDATSPNPSGSVINTTIFIVEVTDANGCSSIDSTLVIVLPEVNITSGFTPNGDGVNDRWIIDNMELFPNNTVNVFNRWGAILFQQMGYNSGNAWDGTYEGKELPVGTYYYTIVLNDQRFPDPFTGPITIVR